MKFCKVFDFLYGYGFDYKDPKYNHVSEELKYSIKDNGVQFALMVGI